MKKPTIKKPKMTFHEFCSIVRGYRFEYKGEEVPKYKLYWSCFRPDLLITNNYQFKAIQK